MKKKLIAAIGLSLVVTANTSNLAYAAPLNEVSHNEKDNSQKLKKSQTLKAIATGIQIINGWGTPAGLISFNPKTMQFKISQYNQYLGNSENTFLNIKVYNPSTGKIVYTVALSGDDNTGELSKLLNKKTFDYGDTITISYDNAQGKVEVNNNGKNEMNTTGSSQTFEITKEGLVQSTVHKVSINPLDILGSGKTDITNTTLTGMVDPNQEVTIIVAGKVFNTTSNSQGEFSVNINDKNEFTLTTPIEVYSKGRDLTQVYPTIVNGVQLQNSEIKVINGWGGVSAVIKPNPVTMKFDLTCSGGYIGKISSNFLNIQVYDPSKGEITYTKSFIGDDNTSALEAFLSGKSFNYGDVITLSYDNGQGQVEVDNGKTNIMNTTGAQESFEVTKAGLTTCTLSKVKVKPFTVLGTGTANVTKGVLQGVALPNETVTAILNGQKFTAKSNSKGNFNINITDSNGFNTEDKIMVFAKGQAITFVKPTFIKGVELQNSQIAIIDAWNNPSAGISFNLATMKLNTYKNYESLYLNDSAKFNISILDTNTGTNLAGLDIDSQTTQDQFKAAFNDLPFAYGDVIKIVNKNVSQNEVEIKNGKNSNYLGEAVNYYKITKSGLVKYTTKLNIKPFEVLDGENAKSGILTGIAPADSKVIVVVGDNTFIAKANENGQFSVQITSTEPFTAQTPIKVWSKGCVPTTVYPIAPANLGIGKSMLQLNNNSLGIAQTLTFNPTTMQIVNSGSGFATQLIDKNTGLVKASIGSGNFNAFTSKNDINGAKFNYGDILSIYETEETYLSDGKVNLTNGKKTTSVNDVKEFKAFEITPQGLILVKNKELTNVSALYKGNSKTTITAKTTPNTNVKLYYGTDKMITVKSNSNGEVSATVPLNEANIGSEVRVFLNNQNNQNVIVTYDKAIFNTNNSIQLVNNESFPVIDVTFSPATYTISSIVYPQDKTYAGVFYGNRMNISFIDPKTGDVIKSVTSSRPQEIQSFSNDINNMSYTDGEIIRVEYDSNLGTVNVVNNKKEIGNTNGEPEYFEITNKGLVNITNKFITTKPLDILGNGQVKSTVVQGSVKPNEEVIASIDGKAFTTKSDASGNFSLNVTDENGFTEKSVITISAQGYIPTHINLGINKSIQLSNSYINFYRDNFGWEATSIAASIGFDVNNNTFFVNNYEDSFENGKENYFTFYLYNSQGKELMSQGFNGGSTASLKTFLNGKSFAYGDVIGIKYNPKSYKPMVVNNNTVIGNISGEMEYFKITKTGLIRVDFGNKAVTSNVSWNSEKLNITANLATGNNNAIVNGNKRLVLLNENNQILASENTSTKNINGENVITGSFNSSDLAKIKQGQVYKIALQINGAIMPLYVKCNTLSTSTYILSGDSNQNLSIQLKEKDYVNIKNSNEISSYLSTITNDISNISTTSLAGNESEENKVYAAEFINRIGAKNIEALYNKSTQNANFINWVLNNNTAMQEFLSGANPDGHTPEGQPRASYSSCLQVWSNIWNTYTNSHDGFNLKLAIATALTNGGTIYAFPSGRPVGNPVERYNIFETLNANGSMMPNFKTLDVSHLTYVTNVPIANDQIIPMRNIILQNHNSLITPGLLNNIAYTINYNLKNPHTGASVFGPNFYGKNPRIKTVWYDGGVCGATGRMGATGEQVFGIPAVQTPQPGHNAFIWYDSDNNTWNIGNAIDGWNATYDADMSGWSNEIAPNQSTIASYNLLYQKADTKNLPKSNMYLYLANTQKVYSNKLTAINEAIKIEPLNLGAWIDLVNLYKANPNTTIEQYNILKNNIIMTFKEYPMPMYNLLYQLKGIYTKNGLQNQFNDYVNSIKSVLENEVNQPTIACIATAMLGQMKADGLIAGNVVVQGGINIENVWNGEIANISLDGTNKQLHIVPSGSYTNPYGTGETFKILFEKANGNVIKELVVNHQEPNPGAQIEKTFNKLPYEYGDKIVIEYVNSSIITANNIITENGVVKTMNVNQPSTTFYITSNGLSLTKSGQANASSISVMMKDSKGVEFGKSTVLNGELGENVVYKNLRVPTGYKLASIIFDGDVIYKGSNINDAEYAIAQEKYGKSETLEIIVSKIDSINTTSLSNEIIEGKKKLNSGILYTESTTIKLQQALAQGEKVLENISATPTEVTRATQAINKALKELKPEKVTPVIPVKPNKPVIPVKPDIKPVVPVKPEIKPVVPERATNSNDSNKDNNKNIDSSNDSNKGNNNKNIDSSNGDKVTKGVDNTVKPVISHSSSSKENTGIDSNGNSGLSNTINNNNSDVNGKQGLINNIENANNIIHKANTMNKPVEPVVDNSSSTSEQVNHRVKNLQHTKDNAYTNEVIEQSKKDIINAINNARKVVNNPNATKQEVSNANEYLAKKTRELSNEINKIQSSDKVKEQGKDHQTTFAKDRLAKKVKLATTDHKSSKEQSDKAMETGVGILATVGALGLIEFLVMRKKKKDNEE